MSFHWQDDDREEVETKAPGDKRELMVHVFYPAADEASGTPAAYMPDADALRLAMSKKHHQTVAAMRAHSIENAPLPPGDARYPLAIVAPGGGMKGLSYHALCEDLASHGWIVAAIDPPYNARAVRMPDGRVLGDIKPNERGWPQPKSEQEYRRFYQERIEHWCRDISFVIDQLAALDAGNGPLAGQIDLARGVGVVGHSRGGQAAGTVRLLDERVRGGINLDGTQRELSFQPVKGDNVGGDAPFLWIQKTLEVPTDEQLKRVKHTREEFEAEMKKITDEWDRRLGSVTGGAMRVYIDRPGITHIDFSDEPFWDDLSETDRAAKQKTIADTRAWVRAFFDGTVRGEWADFKRLAGEKQPEVTVYTFGQMWP
jgi:hypothetical protein